jgi:hypothetical protein
MNHQERLIEFAVNRATKVVSGIDAERITEVVSATPAITQRVGMYLVGDFSRATINLAKLDELLIKALAE